jgi:hypothetical protein
MVNIGILGDMDCGKTSVFVNFMNELTSAEERILAGAPGGPEMFTTQTVDFIRFSWKGFIHVLYGTGGHKTPITDYYRVYVLRNANRFVCMFDLSEPLDTQMKFYDDIEIPSKQISIYLNKFDLAPDNVESYKEEVHDYFLSKKKKLIKDILVTVAVKKPEFEEERNNCQRGILNLCEFDAESSAFDVWDGQG